MGGDTRACEGEIRKGIVGEAAENDESQERSGSRVLEQTIAGSHVGEQGAEELLRHDGKKGRAFVGPRSRGGEA